MKKINILLFAVSLAFLAVSCAKEAQENGTEGKNLVTLRAAVESRTAPASKVSIESETGKFFWSTGDRIAVNTSEGYITSEALEAGGESAAYKVDLKGAVRQNFAVYPVGAAVAGHETAADLQVTLPAEYELENLKSEVSPVVMIAKGNTADAELLTFRHVGGLFRLAVKDVPKGVNKLTVTFDRDVTGTFTVKDADTDTPTIEAPEATDKNTVTFLFPALSAMQDVTLNIPVPVGTFGLITVKSWVDNVEFPCRITVGKASGLAVARKAAFGKDVYMPVFSVSATRKVVFSPGNLEAYTTNSGANWTWRFAEEQYSLLSSNATVDGKMHITTESGARMYFRWSTTKAADYGINAEATGASYLEYVNGTFLDWGTNAIEWGGYTYPENTWRTLGNEKCYYFSRTYAGIDKTLDGTRGEWGYLFEERPASTVHGLKTHTGTEEEDMENTRFMKVRIDSKDAIRGVVLFPDHFEMPEGLEFLYSDTTLPHLPAYLNRTDAWYRTELSMADWKKLEAAGCVYIPRGDTFYYTSTYNAGDATSFGVNMFNIASSGNDIRVGWGRPWQNYQVRLVRDAN